ncbi:MAG: cell division protein FtsI (penicillin-binding protein 3) [Candidatus Berkelbacteria bacterium Athens1014_28]|uniref:Cell division protein FtsI (Penicillin-binding protein 3) n=1 Tax=Candidatus Berkelbacteria bacterium Athens1014_28 TaxID=2017145 RepID=A0A554LPN7_9BACT|nr:MAG: cell division protein FtsI (penicillin-binding protein 3) [Candidatus Berkelbacteria bacterium Athens1014_28]
MNGRTVKNPASKSHSSEMWRIYILTVVIFLVSGIIIARLYCLQVLAYENYSEIAQGQHQIFKELIPDRGEIFLKDKNEKRYPLAINRDYPMVYAVPREISDREKVAYALSSILNMDADMLRQKISDPNDVFEIIKHRLSDDEASKVREFNADGIKLIDESFRYYLGGELASQVIGFVGNDGETYRGRYGVEASWENELKGMPGSLNQERDAAGRWISIADRDLKPANHGVDLVLTIDYTVQYEVEKILRQVMEKHGADDGAILVMEPKTGKILAMAGWPTFNPNEYSGVEDMSRFINSSISTSYEPGSIFKPITMAIGIDDGKIEPETEYVDTGFVKEAGYVIKNSEEKVYGKSTMNNVLENSINTGVIFVEKLVGNKNFSQYVSRFGFGELSGIELPGESAGNLANLKAVNRDIQFFTASFGQGITTTPLQMVNAFSVIANGGVLMKPQIVDKVIYADGKEEDVRPQEIRRVIGEDTAKKVSDMLRSVVVNGHGKRADVPGYLVGGKTGTAQVAKKGSQGYEDSITIGSFAGFAPIDNPMFTVLVKISNPKDVQWAESSAAPAFGEIMKFLLEYYDVKPTEIIDDKQTLPPSEL